MAFKDVSDIVLALGSLKKVIARDSFDEEFTFHLICSLQDFMPQCIPFPSYTKLLHGLKMLICVRLLSAGCSSEIFSKKLEMFFPEKNPVYRLQKGAGKKLKKSNANARTLFEVMLDDKNSTQQFIESFPIQSFERDLRQIISKIIENISQQLSDMDVLKANNIAQENPPLNSS